MNKLDPDSQGPGDPVIGRCLCGEVVFSVCGTLPGIYQCHCSKCRRVSGSASNSAMIVDADRFRWLEGEKHIQRFQQASGFKSEFCEKCGSPVPNATNDKLSFWIPAGLLPVDIDARITKQVYVGSKAHWEVIPRVDGVTQHDDNGDKNG